VEARADEERVEAAAAEAAVEGYPDWEEALAGTVAGAEREAREPCA
jgi:hypothetical protein